MCKLLLAGLVISLPIIELSAVFKPWFIAINKKLALGLLPGAQSSHQLAQADSSINEYAIFQDNYA